MEKALLRGQTKASRTDAKRTPRAAHADALVRLNELSSRLWRAQSLGEGLEEMLSASIELLGADMGHVRLLDSAREVLLIAAHRGFKPDFLAAYHALPVGDMSAAARALRTGERCIIEDVETDAAYAPFRATARAAGFQAVQSTPLVAHDGKVVGIVSTHTRAAHRYSEDDLRKLDLYARQACDFIERWRADEALRTRARQQHAVARLGELALRERDLQRVFERATAMIAETLEVDYCKVLQLLPGGAELLLRAGCGWKTAIVGESRVSAGHDSQAGYTLLSDRPVVVADLREERRFNGPSLLVDHGVVSGMSCIIRGAGGAPWGVLGAHATRRILFNDDDVSFLVAVANIMGDAILRHQADEALKETDRRKDEFLATLSHELRNPLAPLMNALYLLRRKAGRTGPGEPIHEMMERQLNHLVRLVDDLLETSRISRGAFDLKKERIDLATVVRNAVETSDPLIKRSGHRLEISLPEESLWLDGDPVRLSQVLANLLNNAAKYTEDGGHIELRARREDDTVAISVRDSGIGMAPEVQSCLFEMFSRGNRRTARGDGSLGIGLALARRLAEMHGGTIEARSEGPGKGSEFTVRLPLAANQKPAVERAARVHRSLFDRRILVVDDNHDAADSLGMLLQILGADVRIARDGPQALQELSAYDPAVVLLDIGMPDMDGYEVARRIRVDFPDKRPALVALTGWGQEDDRRRAREAGFDHHLIKPADVATLQALLASLQAAA